ncbi:MAG: nitroreductase [Thermodesulfobacteriota bacterium]
MDLFTAMKERRSVRAYLDKPVSREITEEIIGFAGLAPSAMNLQPWEYIVTRGEEKDRLVRHLIKARQSLRVACGPGTAKPLPGIFSGRTRAALSVMEPFISILGKSFNEFIEEGSCSFYGAPVAVIVVMDRLFPKIRYVDVGMSLSFFLLAAHAKGLSTCPIGLITAYAEDIADVLNIPDDKEILLGMALGYPDPESPANRFKITRAPVGEILRWYE